MTAIARKTPEEIEALKKSWVNDPCWDIEDSEGFEAHKEELLAFRKEEEARWQARRHENLLAIAHRIGHPGDIKVAEQYESFKEAARSNTNKAADTLIYYLRMAIPNFDQNGNDHSIEIRDAVEDIVSAAACETMARSIFKP